MAITITQAALMSYLKQLDEALFAKVLETRGAVATFLSRVPTTFSNYTDHSIDHSDEIIRQLSNLLFRSEDDQPVIKLSSAEAYILCIAAILHDSGMVVSEREKISLLGSDEWLDFIAKPQIVELWTNLQKPEAPASTSSAETYTAGVQLRYLVAEFFRRRHASRAAEVVLASESQLANFAFGEPAIKETIADICEGHGLDRSDLEDSRRFPFERDLSIGRVNVRLLAVLLRLGDLLDVRFQRACPLLISANSPLPVHSESHWTQYHRIKHLLVKPERVELRAECETQSEHRLLADWFDWLESEAKESSRLLSGSTRHAGWQAPNVRTIAPDATVVITPSATATYKPVSWRFELDADLVFQRLIKDLYDSPLSFVGELIQNAADTSRAALSDRLVEVSGTPTTDGASASAEMRSGFPISIALNQAANYSSNALNVEPEQLVLEVEDVGRGMTSEDIQKYLLQVGRSFYDSPEFSRRYSYHPTSGFGLGFLSVFAVSDLVVVETRSRLTGESSRVTLTGPRSYLLFENSDKQVFGTRVSVYLRPGFDAESIVEYITTRAQMLEFPMSIDWDGRSVRSNYVGSDDNAKHESMPSLYEDGSTLVCRASPIDPRTGIRGNLFHLVLKDADGHERWDKAGIDEWIEAHPFVNPPQTPASLYCYNGMSVGGRQRYDSRTTAPSQKIDVRRKLAQSTRLSRTGFDSRSFSGLVNKEWETLLSDHLAVVDANDRYSQKWIYKQALSSTFEFLSKFWNRQQGMIPLFVDGVETVVSLAEASDLTDLIVVAHERAIGEHSLNYSFDITDAQRFTNRGSLDQDQDYSSRIGGIDSYAAPTMLFSDVRFLSYAAKDIIFARPLRRLEVDDGWQTLHLGPRELAGRRISDNSWQAVELRGYDERTIAVPHFIQGFGQIALSVDHELVRVLLEVANGARRVESVSPSAAAAALAKLGRPELDLVVPRQVSAALYRAGEIGGEYDFVQERGYGSPLLST